MPATLDHDLFDYSSIRMRPPLRWPGNAAVAVCVFVHFEDFEIDLPEDTVSDPRYNDILKPSKPNYITQSWFEYGNRVGIDRVLESLSGTGHKVTVAAGSSPCRRYPSLVEEFQRRGYEFAAAGKHANAIISTRMTEQEERAFIRESSEAVAEASGTRATGWIGSAYGESPATLDLIAEEGFTHVVDWSNDDRPYMAGKGRALVSIPRQSGLDDVELLFHRRMMPWNYPPLIAKAFERLSREGEQSGMYLGIHIHPWLIGRAYMARYLDETLRMLDDAPGIWRASASEIANHMRSIHKES